MILTNYDVYTYKRPSLVTHQRPDQPTEWIWLKFGIQIAIMT